MQGSGAAGQACLVVVRRQARGEPTRLGRRGRRGVGVAGRGGCDAQPVPRVGDLVVAGFEAGAQLSGRRLVELAARCPALASLEAQVVPSMRTPAFR